MTLLELYPSPEEREKQLEALAHRSGAQLDCFGSSVEGRPLRAAFLRSPRSDAPTLFVVANIHGPEFIGTKIALALLEALALKDPGWEELRLRANLWIAPSLNPDAYARTHARGGIGSLGELRSNAHGVDLNRNFPLPPGERRWPVPGAGSSNPRAATYHGPAPASEPEVRALIAAAEHHRPHAAVGLHSFMGRLIPARTRDAEEYAQYVHLCRTFASAQPRWKYSRLASRLFDVFTGEQEDYLHHVLGCWSVCVETYTVRESLRTHLRAPSIFARFNPPSPGEWVKNDLAGILAFFGQALELQRPGRR